MSLESAFSLIDSVSGNRVLFVGETVEDVYHYCTPLGRPLKDLVISVKRCRTEHWCGGIVAASHHARGFCGSVDVLSDRSIIKTRFLESAYFRKLFEFYEGVQIFETTTQPMINSYDAVCVIDYGHGMMNEEYQQKVEVEAGFLAINVQANSGNYGFNLATKYNSCDYLVTDELEARLATHNQFGRIEHSLELLTEIAPKVVITLGIQGAIGCDKNGLCRMVALSKGVVDTMGAGDAFFAVTAPMAKTASIEDLLLIGNAAGALKVQNIGHSKPVTKARLVAYLKEQTRGAH